MGKWVNYNVNICDKIFNDLDLQGATIVTEDVDYDKRTKT